MSVTIPAELQDLIIDEVAPDAPSLRHCALVCRTWHPRSSLHLFSTITVKSPRTFKTLSALVKTQCIWLAHTRTLRLHMPGAYDGLEIAAIISGLPQLEELSVSMWDMLSSSHLPPKISLPTLRALRIDASLDAFRVALSTLGPQVYNLELLDVSGLKTDAIPDLGRLLLRIGPSLSALRIGFTEYTEGFTDDALRKHISFEHLPHLRSLSLANLSFHPGYLCNTSYSWVPHVIRQCAADVLVLELGFPPVMGPGALSPRVRGRISEHLLDWVPWAECAEVIPYDTQVVLDVWPRGMVKSDAVLRAVKCRLHSIDVRRPLLLSV